MEEPEYETAYFGTVSTWRYNVSQSSSSTANPAKADEIMPKEILH